MTADELIEKAKDQRKRGRLQEAMVSADSAATLDPTNANAFWQLALCEIDLNGAASAAGTLQKVIELAPRFAYGWTKLGLSLRDQGEDDQARGAFERATNIEPDDQEALFALAQIYEHDGERDEERRVLQKLDELKCLNPVQINRLGILHHNEKEYFAALNYYQRAAAMSGRPYAFFNMGLVLEAPTVARFVDALDSFRRALAKDPGYESATKAIARLLPNLVALRQKVITTGKVLLDQEHWYADYINPFELLDMEPDGDFEEKSIQRKRKNLLLEIEVSEGRIGWMDGLTLDRSRAIGICDELNNSAVRRYHRLVFDNVALSAFLQMADLQHFFGYEDDTTAPLATIEAIESEPEGFGRWLSRTFSKQFDLVLAKAIEQKNIGAIECVLSGRRWVRPEDEDRCFEAAHQQVDRLLDALRNASETSEKTKPTAAALESRLTEGHLREILGVLPHQVFYREQQEAASILRTISVNAYNQHNDAVLAKAILKMSEIFAARSRSLLDRFKEDLATLDDRIEQELKNEAHIRIGEASCAITRAGARVGHRFIAAEDITTLRWGSITTNTATSRSILFKLVIGSPSESEIKIEWTASTNIDEQQEFFLKLTDATITYLLPRVMENVRRGLENLGRVKIGTVVLTKEGIEFVVEGWFKSKTVSCSWQNLVSTIENGDVVLSDRSNLNPMTRRATPIANFALHEVNNAIVLHLLAQGA